MFLRRKLLAAAVATCSLLGAPGSGLAQDTNQPSSTPTSPPAAATVEPNVPAPSPAVPPQNAPPPPGQAPAETVTAPPPQGGEEAVGAPAAGARRGGGKQFGEEITVTGSRIRRKDLNTPAPVTVISHEQIAESGKSTIGEFLQSLPEQAGGANSQVNNGGDGSQTVDLRGIQANRTLVLINGRRMISSATAQSFYETVDLNAIPTAAIERVEILKDGGSSIYGSDAIGGVVNIITRKKMDGAELTLQYGNSYKDDGTLKEVSLVAGSSNERSNFLVAGGYSEQGKVRAGKRGHMGTIYSKNFNTGQVSPRGSIGTPDGIFYLYDDCTRGSSPACDHLWDLATADGATPFDETFTAGRGVDIFQDPGDRYNYQRVNYLYTPLRRWQLWASGDYKVADYATVFFEGSFVNRYSRQQLAPEPLYTGALGGGPINPISEFSLYNPYGVQIDVGRRLVEFGDRVFTQDSNTYRLVGGLRGEIGDWGAFFKGWAWNTSLVYASNNNTYDNQGSLRADKINAALGPSMIDPATGQPICVTSPGNPATKIEGCVPLNTLGGPGSITPSMISGLAFDGTDRASWSMSSLEVNADGELFKLWAQQPASLGAGYEYRREWGYALPNPISGAGESSGNIYLASTPGG
jgi:outer membrane receptor protein involved in Fe transport